MKKKFLALLIAVAAVLTFSCVAFAAKPSIELTDVYFTVNAFDGVTPTVCFRNNSNKTIKYVTFTLVPLNTVGDRAVCTLRGYSAVTAQLVGPIEPTKFEPNVINKVTSPFSTDRGPFQIQQQLSIDYYFGAEERNGHHIFLDKDGNPYYWDSYQNYPAGTSPAVFLTDDEIQNAVYDAAVEWECLWYNSTIDDVVVTKAEVIYMDGSKETINQSALYSEHFRSDPTNAPYYSLMEKYASVYDYEYYKANNPDLAAIYGDNQWKYLEHFVNSGMKEGRQGSAEFNLEAYKQNNQDLIPTLGDDNQKYYEHYIAGGKAEGRKAA